MAWLRRLWNRARAARVSRDIERELAFHLAERVDELMHQGMPEPEAAREARRRLGNYTLLTERTREVDMFTWLDSLFADLRYAVRTMRSSPLFTTVVVLSLALGIGANTAIFSLVNGLLLRALPVAEPAELVQVSTDSSHFGSFTNPLWEAFRDRQDAFRQVAAVGYARLTTTAEGTVTLLHGNWVSGGFFATLGVPAAIGRTIAPSDDFRGCPAIAVLGHGYWARAYGSDPGVIGRAIDLNDKPVTIVGVAAPAFFGIRVGSITDLYLPLCAEAAIRGRYSALDGRSTFWLRVLGRRPSGTDTEELARHLTALAPTLYDAAVPLRWGPERQEAFRRGTLLVAPAATGVSSVRDRYRDILIALLGMVSLFLLIATTNVASLLLARATARQREIAMRIAIGAGRGRLIRQFLTESLLLSLTGAGLGLLFAGWSGRLIVTMLSTRFNVITLDLSLDTRVLAFTAAVAILTGVIFGLAPAWRALGVEPQGALHAGGSGVTEGGGRATLGKVLVVGQVAFSLVLLMGAFLLMGTFWRLQTLDPGFRRYQVLLASVNAPRSDTAVTGPRPRMRDLLTSLRGLPGVRAASASELTPIEGSSMNDNVLTDPSDPRGDAEVVWFNRVSDGYFETLGTRLLAGRDFRPEDGEATERLAIVNPTMARRVFGTPDVLGREFRTRVSDTEASPPYRIVGIVEDAKYKSLREDMLPTAYTPLTPQDRRAGDLTYQLATITAATTQIGSVRAAVTAVDPTLRVEFTTLADQVADSLTQERLLAILSGFFGALAVLLATLGLYGLMSYTVARRAREIGIRMALGASRAGVHGMVLGEVARLVGLGVTIGVLGSLAAAGLIAGFLYGVRPLDPASLASATALLLVVALLAGLLPARRASRVDPLVVLRED